MPGVSTVSGSFKKRFLINELLGAGCANPLPAWLVTIRRVGCVLSSLKDGTRLEGEEASHAMKDLADPRHTRVVGGIDLDIVLGEKTGPGL